MLLHFQIVHAPGILQLVVSGLILSLSRDLTLHHAASSKHDWISLRTQCMAYFHFLGPLSVYALLSEGRMKCRLACVISMYYVYWKAFISCLDEHSLQT